MIRILNIMTCCGRLPAVVAPVVSFATAFLPAQARGDRRSYAETYEAVTAPAGELDVELWSTYATDGEVSNGPASRGFRNMLELEYGLTAGWDVALYNIFDVATDAAGPTGYGGLKVETRYRPVPAATWFVDPIVYLEYQYLLHGDARHKGELKLILAKDVERWNFALNVAAEFEHLVSGDTIPEAEYALGISRDVVGPALRVGLEVFGKAEKPPGSETEAFAWAGPAVSWATATSDSMRGIWITAGGGKGVTNHSDGWYARAIAGLQF